jgi:hypothetical protein
VRFCRSFGPSEFSVLAARRRSLPPGVVLSWNSLLVQSFLTVEVSCLWVCFVVRGGLGFSLCVSTLKNARVAANKEANASRSRFVVGPCLSFTVFLRRGPLIVVQYNQLHPLFEFRVPPESCSVNPSRPAAAGPLLSWAFVPFSTCRHRRSTCCGCAAPTTVPPSGFGYPLGGLLPSKPGRFCFTPPALLGFSLRSLPSVGSFGCFHPNRPTYRFSCRCSRRYGRAGPAGRGSWAFLRRKFLSAGAGLMRSLEVTPLGFVPSRVLAQTLTGISPDLLSRAFPAGSDMSWPRGAPEFRSVFALPVRVFR